MAPQAHLNHSLVLLLRVSDVLPDQRLAWTNRRGEVPLFPGALAEEVSLVLTVHPGQVNLALAVVVPTTGDTASFEWLRLADSSFGILDSRVPGGSRLDAS